MKKIKYLSCLALLMMVTCIVCAQPIDNEHLIDSLRKALFTNSDETIEVSAFFGHKKQVMDSIYLVRKTQPRIDVILPFLEKIAYTKDSNFIEPLKGLYNRQQAFFKKEWEPVLKNNFYACDAANEQFNILEAFEETIHSLAFGNTVVGKNAKREYFKAYIRSQYSYYHIVGGWKDALKDWHIISSYYMMLRENRWVGPPLGRFSFIEPYIDEIAEQIVDELFLSDSLNVIASDYIPTLEQFELDYLCGIISLSEVAAFNEKLIILVLSDKRNKPAYVRSRILNLIKNPKYKERVKAILLEKSIGSSKVERLNALYGLIFFHEKDVIVQYQKILSALKIDDIEKQAIKAHLSMLNRQLNASKEVKEFGAKLLKQMED